MSGRGLERERSYEQEEAVAAIASIKALMRQSRAGLSRTEGWTA